jgi:hypothetical protein
MERWVESCSPKASVRRVAGFRGTVPAKIVGSELGRHCGAQRCRTPSIKATPGFDGGTPSSFRSWRGCCVAVSSFGGKANSLLHISSMLSVLLPLVRTFWLRFDLWRLPARFPRRLVGTLVVGPESKVLLCSLGAWSSPARMLNRLSA